MIFETMESPRPTPVFFVVTKGLKICSRNSAGIRARCLRSALRRRHAAAVPRPRPRFPRLDAQHATAGAHGVVSILHDIDERLLAQTFIQRHQRQISAHTLSPLAPGAPFHNCATSFKRAIENGGDVLRRQIGVQAAARNRESASPARSGGWFRSRCIPQVRWPADSTLPASASASPPSP